MEISKSKPDFHIPEGRQSFRIWEVAGILCHSNDQILKLIDEGKFGPIVDCGSGKKSSLVIPRSGIEKFLRENSK